MASYVTPERAAAYTFFTSLTSQADVKLFQDNPTLAAGDVIVIKDGVLDGNIDTLPVVVTSATRVLNVTLSAAEMTADNVTIIFHDAAGAQWCDLVVNIQTTTKQIDDIPAAAPAMITGQQVRDAMKLDAGVGAPAAGSVDAHLDTIVGFGAPPGALTAQQVRDALKLDATAGAPAAGSVDKHLDDIIVCACAGTGSVVFVYTVTDVGTGLPIANCLVWVTSDLAGLNILGQGYTDGAGNIQFLLNPGNAYFWRQRGGYTFTPQPDLEVVL